jgi:hypothetical protein
MQTTAAHPQAVSAAPAASPLTRALLTSGLAAGPLYVGLGLLQMFIRDGFDIRYHALSLLANGDLGWIQAANFVVSGLLTLAGALGLRRALSAGRGRTWGPLLVGVYGLSLLGAAVFTADPALGFPPGTPSGPPTVISTNGLLHFVAGGLGFLSLIAATFIFARRFAGQGRRAWAAYSVATGVSFFAAFAGIASGGGQVWLNLAFAAAVVIAWAWVSAVSAHFRAQP